MNEYIKSDLYRYEGKTNWLMFFNEFFRNDCFRVQVAHRLINNSTHRIFYYLGIILYLFNFHTRKRIVIPLKVKIGYGLYIAHNGPIIINPDTVIGNNVSLYQFTTIGSMNHKAATIGNNVYVGPNVCLVEDVNIGDNATIGAGSIVVKDIPCNATAVGNYAKVVNYKNPGSLIIRPYKYN